MSLTDHLATTLRLDLSRSRWFALAPVEQVSRCYNGIGPESRTTTTGNDTARPPRAGLFVSTLRRIIADVHGVPDFLDRATPSNLPRSRPYRRRPVLWAHGDQRAGIGKGQDLHGGSRAGSESRGVILGFVTSDFRLASSPSPNF